MVDLGILGDKQVENSQCRSSYTVIQVKINS